MNLRGRSFCIDPSDFNLKEYIKVNNRKIVKNFYKISLASDKGEILYENVWQKNLNMSRFTEIY